jgi:hypothetical protein
MKLFSATKARDREVLGETVTAWISANPQLEILETIIRQSSDNEFHCVSITLLYSAG